MTENTDLGLQEEILRYLAQQGPTPAKDLIEILFAFAKINRAGRPRLSVLKSAIGARVAWMVETGLLSEHADARGKYLTISEKGRARLALFKATGLAPCSIPEPPGLLKDWAKKHPAPSMPERPPPPRLPDSLAGSQGVGIGGVGPASAGGGDSGGGGLGSLGTGGRGAGQGYGSGAGKLKSDIKPPRKPGQKLMVRREADPLIALEGDAKPAGTAKAPPVDALSDHLLESKKNIPVWYGTNRKPKDILREQDGFLNEADQIMHYGYCMVNVPKRYVKGGSGRGWLLRLITREPTELEFGNVNPLPQEKFWSKLAGTLKKQTDANSMLLFVHGYNVSFEDAANSAGQLSYELDLPVSFFSWSSHRTLKDYAGDTDKSVESVQHLKEFLGQLWQSAASTGKRLHVIAHSMGNRALLQALHEIALAARPDGPQLAQVIFAAPDVSRTLFLQQLAAVVEHPGLTAGHTLYASSDKALLASGWLHDNTRAGFLPPATTAPKLATVDVSRYDLSLLGHSYVFNLGPVLEDMFAVLHGAKPRLRSLDPGGVHWVLG